MGDWPGELTSAELLACALKEHPAFRSAADLDRIDPAALSGGEQVDLLVVLEEQRRWFEACLLRVLAAIQAADDSRQGLGQEGVSVALQLPLRTAQTRLAQAKTLVTELPRTLAAVATGAISAGHANVLAEAVWRLPADPALPTALEDAVLPPVLAAGCVTVPQLKRRVRRAVLCLDPSTAEQRHQRAVAERRVEYHPGEDGMASLIALLPAPEAQLIHGRLTTATKLLPSEDARTVDQQRADLFVDAVLSGLPVDGLPRVQGRRPAIQVTVSADTLPGLDDQPGQLTGYGPSPPTPPAGLPPTPPAPGAGYSPTPTPERCSTSAPIATGHPNDCATTWPPATRPARSPPASNPATAANPTTPSPSTKADRPPDTTSPPPAGDTTRLKPAPAGPTATTETAATPGPPTPATPTPAPPADPGAAAAIPNDEAEWSTDTNLRGHDS